MASIRDVAKEAGVAVCTVSRVLNGTANVAPATQEKIEAAMKKLNYVPNELARGMFRKQSNTIAMLVPNIQHPWFSSLASQIEKELSHHNYKLMLFSTSDDAEKEKECFQILRSNIVDGIICGTSSCSQNDYLQVEKPMVMLDYKAGDQIPVIVSDHKQGGLLAANEFIRANCTYVIHITSTNIQKNILSLQSHEILDYTLQKAGIQSRRVPIRWNDFDFDGYFELAKYLLEEYPQIDGIMAADLPATAFIKAATALGIKVPDDLSIIAYDGTYVTKTNSIPITTIQQPFDEIGKAAVDKILSMIHNSSSVSSTGNEIIFPVKLEKGATTK